MAKKVKVLVSEQEWRKHRILLALGAAVPVPALAILGLKNGIDWSEPVLWRNNLVPWGSFGGNLILAAIFSVFLLNVFRSRQGDIRLISAAVVLSIPLAILKVVGSEHPDWVMFCFRLLLPLIYLWIIKMHAAARTSEG